jgi:hypothetical protein
MNSGVDAVVERLRTRRVEIERAIFVRVREAVPAVGGEPDTEYVEGLRAAVVAAVEFALAGIERGGSPGSIPAESVIQAHRAARSGVSLDAVLRRYIAGHAVMWDYVMEEADRIELAGQGGLREMSRAQTALLDQLVIGVTREHVAELQRASRSREHRLLERVRALLVGEHADGPDTELDALAAELGYDLDPEHLAVIARGAHAPQVLRDLGRRLDRRLLCVAPGKETVWAWLGGRSALTSADLAQALSARASTSAKAFGNMEAPALGVSFAVGEPARGLAGWRSSHRQAQAAQLVALRRREGLTRYADVALLATALKDEALVGWLQHVYLSPLDDYRKSGSALRETLHAYVAAEHNVSSAAARLKVARTTIVNRLHAIEERLGRTLRPCPAELETNWPSAFGPLYWAFESSLTTSKSIEIKA